MDEQLQKKIDEAKENGYTDEQIKEYLNSHPWNQPNTEPPSNQASHTATLQMAALNGAGDIGDIASKAVEYGVPAGLLGYGAYKLGQGKTPPVQPVAPQAMQQQMNQANQMATQQAVSQPVNQAVNSTNAGTRNIPNLQVQNGGPGSTTPPAGQQAFNQMGKQLTQPLNSPYAQPATEAVSELEKGMRISRMIQELAAKKVLGNMVRGAGVGGAALTYSPPLGPKVPMQGQYKGMEINPNTGRPWTQQEIGYLNR